MKRSRPFRSRLVVSFVSLSSLGLAHCGGDDDAPSAPTGGSVSTGGRVSTGGSGGSLSSGGSAKGGGGGAVGTGGSSTGGTRADAGAGGSDAGAGGVGGQEAGGSAGNQGGGGLGGAGEDGGAAGQGGEGGQGQQPLPVLQSILLGSVTPLATYTGISGQALLVRTLAGHTRVSLQVLGLTASTAYPAHVHAAPCAQGAAGGHYKIDPAIAATEQTNEIWLPFNTDAAGIGSTEVDVTHLARGDAMSVVVHDPSQTGTPKMACADLTVGSATELLAKGSFAPFAQAETLDQTIAGSAELTRLATATKIDFALTGLDGTATYAAHVHALPCGVTTAGGHYKRDTTISATEEANELWLTLGATASGSASGSLNFPHTARLDAQSIVIHRVAGSALKVACADLPIQNFPSLSQQGTSVAFAAATDRGYPNLSASGQLVRSLDGVTRVHFSVSGVTSHSVYPAHVHNLPCAVQSGGAHYKRDTAQAATVEGNELWLNFAAEPDGSGLTDLRADHIARADARSIVIHDTATDAARLACIDLGP